MVSIDPTLLNFVIISFVALTIGIILRFFKQPSVIAYILTGILLGPFGIGLIKDVNLINTLGNYGVVLLLFFVGMEINLSELAQKWRIAVIGTILQVIISILVVFGLGYYLNWGLGRIILMGFVISLSSTAVVIKILETKNELKSKTGQDVISILLIQDIIVIPMIIIISLLSGGTVNQKEIILQVIGGIIAILFIVWLLHKKEIRLPFSKKIKEDHELQILGAFVLCFGISIISGLFYLSTALGAFIAGIFLSSAKETEWVHHSLHSFKVIFLAIFFVSVGMLINFKFLFSNLNVILIVLFLVYLTNTLINSFIFKINGRTWRESFYGGALLAQIGEFSFILATIGLQTKLITDFSYQMTIEIIALSLMISPFWISFFCKAVKKSEKIIDNTQEIIKRKIKTNSFS